MARGEFECAVCGDSVYIFAGSRKEVDNKAQWHRQNKSRCEVCRAEENKAETAKNALLNEEAGLPALKGSEKQIAWAETIRRERIEYFDELKKLICHTNQNDLHYKISVNKKIPVSRHNQAEEDVLFLQEIIRLEYKEAGLDALYICIKGQTYAGWWIDNRYRTISELGRILFKEIKDLLLIENTLPTLAEKEAKEEATLRPPNPISTAIVNISLNGNLLDSYCPQAHENLKTAYKALSLEWNADTRSYQRQLDALSGDPIDRIAELAHRILAAGFNVRLYNDDARQRALSAKFSYEIKRWIRLSCSDKYPNWYRIIWPRSDDYYAVAKAIPGSRYHDRAIYIPPGEFDAVQDFASQYEFTISDDVLTAIEHYKTALAQGELIKTPRPGLPPVIIKDRPEIPILDPETADTQIIPELTEDNHEN